MIGKRIQKYVIVRPIGEGGMGKVYLAEHGNTRRRAAIKLLDDRLAGNKEAVSRFVNEAKAANAIQHPNIIDVTDVDIDPQSGVPYLLMEFLDGETLAKRIARENRLRIDTTVEIARQAASALAAAHAQEIYHRDLKPENIFLVPDPAARIGERVKILDFGIAKLRAELSGSSAATKTGALMGTPTHMAPEQWDTRIGPIGPHTDIYALGLVVYEMLCGHSPFQSTNSVELMTMHLSEPPPAPSTFDAALSPELEGAILRALAKHPRDRPPSMDAFGAALSEAAGLAPLPPFPARSAGMLHRWMFASGARRPLVRAAVATAALTLLAVGWAQARKYKVEPVGMPEYFPILRRVDAAETTTAPAATGAVAAPAAPAGATAVDARPGFAPSTASPKRSGSSKRPAGRQANRQALPAVWTEVPSPTPVVAPPAALPQNKAAAQPASPPRDAGSTPQTSRVRKWR